MRITLVAFHFTEYSIELANALASGNEVLLVVNKENFLQATEGRTADFIQPGVNVFADSHYTYKNPRILQNIFLLIRKIRNFRPDIIHVQESSSLVLMLTLMALAKIPYNVTVHDPIVHIGEKDKTKFRRTWIKNRIRKGASGIIVHGEYLKSVMVHQLGFRENAVFVMPHGALFYYRKWCQQTCERKHSILFFGRMYRYKGLECLIEAIPLIKKEVPNLSVIIAGSGPELERLRDKIVDDSTYEIYDQYIPNHLLAKLFEETSLVVLPYLEATQSGVIATAYAFGKPVVTTTVGSIPEMVDDGETGCLVKPQKPEDFAASVLQLLMHDNKRKEMGQNAFQKAHTDLSWNRIAQKTIEVYGKVIELTKE
ncbi:MAG: glycosyltransferase family 4 protein [Candidatus Hodarchaeota archaeon]